MIYYSTDFGVGWVYEIHPPVFITTRKRQQERIERRIYDLLNLKITALVGADKKDNPDDNRASAIQRLFAEEFRLSGTSIEESGGQLLVKQLPIVHRRIEQLFAEQRRPTLEKKR